MEEIAVNFKSGSGEADLQAVWHPPTRRATNGAVIILHGRNYNKDLEPGVSLARGAADLGLTALRFDFRYVHQEDKSGFEPFVQGVDDLLGAITYLEGFGKEIKPKRLYLIGKSLGGLVSLALANRSEYADRINGVAVLGLPLFSEDRKHNVWPEGLPGLKASLLVVQGEQDPYATSQELQQFAGSFFAPCRIELVDGGHSYQPVPRLPDEQENQAKSADNLRRAVNITLDWLEQQDRNTREELRK